jgi:hypothetical protein
MSEPPQNAASRRVRLLSPGFCLNCGHHEDAHLLDEDGDLDCRCPGLRLCAACEGDPEAHDLHVCGRTHV